MAWNKPSPISGYESKPKGKHTVGMIVLAVILFVIAAATATMLLLTYSKTGGRRESVVRDEKVDQIPCPKHSKLIPAVTPAPAPMANVVADKLQDCKFLVNGNFKKKAKVYLCLFSASWCPPCRAEMPRIAKTYAETLQTDPNIELIHFSCDQNDEKALAWAKQHDVRFPVVKPKGGNPLDLRTRGIPHLFILKADGTLIEEGHPGSLFNDAKLRELMEGCSKK